MAVFGSALLKSVMFNTSNCNRNVAFLVKRGVKQCLAMCHYRNMGFWVIFSHFSQFLAKNGWFWRRNLSQGWPLLQIAIEIWLFSSKWRVNQCLAKYHNRDMGLFVIFSHFSQFLAKNGWFWRWYWRQGCSVLKIAIEILRFRLKLGVWQLSTTYRSRDMCL